MDKQGPADPITPLVEGATQVHEVYNAYCAAGFGTDQALYLTGIVLKESLRKTPGASE